MPKGGSKKFFEINFYVFWAKIKKKKFEKKLFFLDPKIFGRPHVGLKGLKLAILGVLGKKSGLR